MMSQASVNRFCVVFRCLTENGWDYTKAAQVFMDLNVRSISECRHLGPVWDEGGTNGSVCPRGTLSGLTGISPDTLSDTCCGFPLCLNWLLAAGGILCLGCSSERESVCVRDYILSVS